MRKIFYTIVSASLLLACSSNKDEQFCSCLDASEALNIQSEKMLDQSSITADDEKKLKELQSKKLEVCKDYTTISAEESKKLRAACEEE